MNTLSKFGAVTISLLDCQGIPPTYMLHICYLSGLLQCISLNKKEVNNRWLVPSTMCQSCTKYSSE